MTPSRSAQGQMSSSFKLEQVHGRVGDDRARGELAAPDRGHPGQLGPLGDGHAGPAARPCSVTVRVPQQPPDVRALARRRGAGDPGQLAEGLGGRDRVVGPPVPAAPHPRCGRSRPARACAAAARRRPTAGRRAASSRVSRPAPSGSERAARRVLVDARPRSPASRRRCPASAAARPTSRTSAARPGTSAGPRPGRAAPGCSTPVCASICGQDLARRWPRRAPPRWRRPASPATPLSSAICSASSTKPTQLVARTRGVSRFSPSRCSPRCSSALCENAGIGRAP